MAGDYRQYFGVISMARVNSVLMVVLAVVFASSLASAGQFRRPAYYAVNSRDLLYGIVVDSFTPSGNLDIAIAGFAGNDVRILLGNGDGTFQKPIHFPVQSPLALAVADFNGDGNQDLAVVEYTGSGQGNIAIFLGDGTGKFKQSASYNAGVEPTGVATADFNGDGNVDLAIAANGGYVTVFMGTGTGKLKQKPAKYKLGRTPWAVAAADLNGDKHPDLAVTNISGYVSVLLNDGSGKFNTPINYDAGGGGISDVEVADLRNNGKQDLVLADSSQAMVVLLNNGDGTFGKPNFHFPECNNCYAPEACVVADFNLDNKLDVACVPNTDDSYFFYGDGKGGFGPAHPFNETIDFHGGMSIAVGDFNHDEAPDLAIPIWDKGKVAVMINAK